MEIFITTMDSPWQEELGFDDVPGFLVFHNAGCADCHRSTLTTDSRTLSYRKATADPAHFFADLDAGLVGLERDPNGEGVIVPLFSDLKRHDLGAALAESFHHADATRNAEFLTARLWGVADSAPYLHDGRALSIDEAIRWHGGEAEPAREVYEALSDESQLALVNFLKTLRLPQRPNQDVIPE